MILLLNLFHNLIVLGKKSSSIVEYDHLGCPAVSSGYSGYCTGRSVDLEVQFQGLQVQQVCALSTNLLNLKPCIKHKLVEPEAPEIVPLNKDFSLV